MNGMAQSAYSVHTQRRHLWPTGGSGCYSRSFVLAATPGLPEHQLLLDVLLVHTANKAALLQLCRHLTLLSEPTHSTVERQI